MGKLQIISLLMFSLQANGQSCGIKLPLLDSIARAMRGNLLLPAENCTIKMGYGRQEPGAGVCQNPGLSFKFESTTNIKAAWDGIISKILMIDSMNVVIINCGGIYISYSNLGKLIVKKGQRIKKGDFLGFVKKDDDGEYAADFLLSSIDGELNPTDWFNWGKPKTQQ